MPRTYDRAEAIENLAKAAQNNNTRFLLSEIARMEKVIIDKAERNDELEQLHVADTKRIAGLENALRAYNHLDGEKE